MENIKLLEYIFQNMVHWSFYAESAWVPVSVLIRYADEKLECEVDTVFVMLNPLSACLKEFILTSNSDETTHEQ